MSDPEQPYQPYQPPSAPLITSLERRQDPMYSPWQVAAGAFLGSPIAGAWLLASNYSALGKPEARRRTLLWGTLSTVVVFAISFILPDVVPSAVVPLAYTVALHQLALRLQGGAFAAHLADGGRRHSNWRMVGIGLAFLVAVFAVMVGVIALLPDELMPA